MNRVPYGPGATASVHCAVESLEDRQLLSGTSAGAAPLHAGGASSSALRLPLVVRRGMAEIPKHMHKKPAPTTTPSLVHDYVGTLKTGGILFGLGSITTTFDLKVTAQTLTSITGTASVEGHRVSGLLTGKLLTNGNFAYKISGDGLGFIMTGHVKKSGAAIAGTASFALKNLGIFKINGKFFATTTIAT